MARIVQLAGTGVVHWWRVADADLPLLRYAFAMLEPGGDPFPVSAVRSDTSSRRELLMVHPGRGFDLDEEDDIVQG